MKFFATALFVLLCVARLHSEVITHWNFNSPVPDGNENTGTYLPKIGTGTALPIGTVTDTFTAGTGSSDTWADNSNLRLVNWPAQGTGNKTSGVEFRVSTAGHRNIRLEWDQRASNTASRYARLQYTLNGTQFFDHDVITTVAEKFITFRSDLSGITGVNDNPNFAIRIVIEFESTATGSGLNGYVAANSPDSNYGAAGSTHRFDMVTVFGDPLVHDAEKAFTLFNYNVWGAGATNWTTNTAQVRAFGRQVAYLQPDIITFQEIPNIGLHEMTNFVHAFLPGYFWATNRTPDGDKGNMILSRFPILRSRSNLGRVSLTNFGFNGVFTRDLFEAEIAVPGWSAPVHAFSVHLKAFNDPVSSPRRAAEASAISNFFVNTFLPYNGHRAYVVAGDFNEDIDRPRSYEQGAIQRIANAQTGLRLTRPVDPFSNDERTWSSQNPTPTI
ncbi:MAG: endonuclease/exonuclease/phosphatase family protein, partial [Limisphaerales bacterium]